MRRTIDYTFDTLPMGGKRRLDAALKVDSTPSISRTSLRTKSRL